MLKNLKSVSIVSIILFMTMTGTQASLDLLAGVEAGIDTDTAMTVSDLQVTQKILSTEIVGAHHQWFNEATGTSYEIIIDHHYSYGRYPCLAYDLVIIRNNASETKSLDACKHASGDWISITSGATAL